MDAEELRGLVPDLRAEGSDVADVEVKRAAKDFPRSVAETLSAFANTPGGGLIVFGLNEGSGFAASGVYDPAACKGSAAGINSRYVIKIRNALHRFYRIQAASLRFLEC